MVEKSAMNRQQRRAGMKFSQRKVVTSIAVNFEDGQTVYLDTSKVMIIDRETKAQLFKAVLQPKES